MDNIPQGYDENGIRNGNGKWYDSEDDKEIGTFDDYDYFKAVREAQEGHFVECENCRKLVSINDTWDIAYGTGYLCEKCKNKLSKLSIGQEWRLNPNTKR